MQYSYKLCFDLGLRIFNQDWNISFVCLSKNHFFRLSIGFLSRKLNYIRRFDQFCHCAVPLCHSCLNCGTSHHRFKSSPAHEVFLEDNFPNHLSCASCCEMMPFVAEICGSLPGVVLLLASLQLFFMTYDTILYLWLFLTPTPLIPSSPSAMQWQRKSVQYLLGRRLFSISIISTSV